MATRFDLILRGGLVLDGGGGEPSVADVGVVNGVIAYVGDIEESGTEEIDARGRFVTPGFVDIHTHYDGQVTWESGLLASSAHGVTSVVMGNCGVGFAPCREDDRDRLVAMMEGVEDIPEVVMAKGLPWDWETFPEYLDAVERRPHDIDFAAQLPHSALRLYVMGERAMTGEPATEADLRRIQALTRQAIEAGALGFSTSKFFFHRTRDGDPIPSIAAEEREYAAIASVLKTVDAGVIETIINFTSFETEFESLKRLARESGRPVSYTLSQMPEAPECWKRALELTREANEEGLSIRAQVIGRPTGMLLGLDLSFNPFSLYPSYQEIAHRPLADKVETMRSNSFRARLMSEGPAKARFPALEYLDRFESMYLLGDPPIYNPPVDQSIGRIAAGSERAPQEVAYDFLLRDEGRAILFMPIANYLAGNMEVARAMITDEHAVLGLGDGGAHYGMISDSGFPTFMLSYWARDREHDPLSVAHVIRLLTSTPAEAVGLFDRGRIAPGYKADLNVIDLQRLRLNSPRVVRDLPAGGPRLMQAAEGFDATIVSGVIINRNGKPTGALPGRLIRGAKKAPRPAFA